MTSIAGYELHLDQNVAVTLTLDIEARPASDEWDITSAIVTELAVWLDDDQAEEPQLLCVDKTAWLRRLLAVDDVVRRQIEERLDEQWSRDREDDLELRSESMERARKMGVE